MTTVLKERQLGVVSFCHVPSIQIPIPHVAPDPDLFPAAIEGFENYSVAPEVSWCGSTYALVNISGLVRTEIEGGMKTAYVGSRTRVEAIRFLQCLDWIHKDNYHDKFTFERIVAYLTHGDPVVAETIEGGFKRMPYPGDDVPWESGTLGLVYIDSL